MKLLAFGFLIASNCLALPLGRGTPLCIGGSCEFQDLPLGTEPALKPLEDENSSLQKGPKNNAAKVKAAPKQPSNLPPYYAGVNRRQFLASQASVFVPPSAPPKLQSIEIGDILEAHLEQSIKASPSTPTPIRALITSAKASGAYVIGTATLDRELKRVLLKFTKLRLRSGQVYSLIATGLSANGQIGMEGDYHSETGLFLVAEFAAATATGIADASVNRQQNALGNWTQEPSMGNHLKQGAVSALSNTTKRLSETAASAPEWTLTQANQEIKIIIEEVPTEATL